VFSKFKGSLPSINFLYCWQAVSDKSPCSAEDFQKLKEFFKAARPFERDFLFVPVYLVGHWALAFLCRPLALVLQLLGRDLSQEMAGERADHARLPPGVFFADSNHSMGSSGLGWENALADVLLRYYMESYPIHNANWALPDTSIAAELFPQFLTPQQKNLWSCALYLLKSMQLFVKDIVKPSLAHRMGLVEESADGGRELLPTLSIIINGGWYTSDDAEAMLPWLSESAKRFVPLPTENAEIQELNGDGDVFLDEVATARENLNRENRLTAEVMELLGSIQVQQVKNCSEGKGRSELVSSLFEHIWIGPNASSFGHR